MGGNAQCIVFNTKICYKFYHASYRCATISIISTKVDSTRRNVSHYYLPSTKNPLKMNTCRTHPGLNNQHNGCCTLSKIDGSSFVEIDPLRNEICFVLVVEGTPRKDMVEVTIVVNVAKNHDCTCMISFSLSAPACLREPQKQSAGPI